MAGIAADKASIPGFIYALTVFIKQEQAKARGVDNIGDEQRREANSSWAKKYPIQVHGSIATWKAKSDNRRQVQYKRQAMRCAFEWQKSEKSWQRDHIWVQEWLTGAKNSQGILYPWQSKMIGELQLVFTIKNKDAGGESGIPYTPKYTEAMVKLLQWRQQGSVNPVYGMVEVEPWPITIGKNPQFLIGKRIFSLAYIIRGVYVILTTLPAEQYWFVNNYID